MYLIKAFREEIKGNKKDIKDDVKCHCFSEASHLESVNGCLEYVIGVLKSDLLRRD